MSAPPPSLAVAILGRSSDAVERLLRALPIDRDPEVIVAWVGPGPAPSAPRLTVLELLPLTSAYARNRALAAATADDVAFVDDVADTRRPSWLHEAPVFPRRRLLELGGFDHALDAGAELADAARRLRRDGRPSWWERRRRLRPSLARDVIHHAPVELAAIVEPASLIPRAVAHRAKTHFVYDAPGSRVVHAYVAPTTRLARALDEREAIRRGTEAHGVPELYAAVRGRDALWIVEERTPGRHPRPGARPDWFDVVADWAVRLGGRPGDPLDADEAWREHRRAAVEAVPPALAPAVDDALDVVGALPSRHMHGDLQPRNVLVDGGRVGAVDWEGAWRRGIPGLDLVFLALLARGRLDVDVLRALSRGADPRELRVLDRLAAVGVDPAVTRPALLAMLATWALGEQRRRSRLGAPRTHGTPFLELVAELGPALA